MLPCSPSVRFLTVSDSLFADNIYLLESEFVSISVIFPREFSYLHETTWSSSSLGSVDTSIVTLLPEVSPNSPFSDEIVGAKECSNKGITIKLKYNNWIRFINYKNCN